MAEHTGRIAEYPLMASLIGLSPTRYPAFLITRAALAKDRVLGQRSAEACSRSVTLAQRGGRQNGRSSSWLLARLSL